MALLVPLFITAVGLTRWWYDQYRRGHCSSCTRSTDRRSTTAVEGETQVFTRLCCAMVYSPGPPATSMQGTQKRRTKTNQDSLF